MTSPELPKEGCQKCALNQFPHTHKEPPVSLEWEAEFDEKFGFYWGGVEDVLPSERGLKNFIRTHLKEAEVRGRMDCLREIAVNYGMDFTEEGIKKALEAAKSPK